MAERRELTLLQRIKIRFGFPVHIGHRRLNGWKGSLPFYAFRCPEHGVVENHPHGFNGRLDCPLCGTVVAVLEETV